MTTEQLKPHTAEQVLTWANDLRGDGGQAIVVEMLESYAALLKVQTEQPSLSDAEIMKSLNAHGLADAWHVGTVPYALIIKAFRECLSAQRQDSDKEPLVWEAITPCYTRFVSEARYQKFSPEVRAWYRPVCQKCGATK